MFTFKLSLLRVVTFVVLINLLSGAYIGDDKSAGSSCVACTVGFGLVGQLAQVHNASIAHALEKVCSLLKESPAYEKECENFVEFLAPLIIDLLSHQFSPDVICTGLGLCLSESNGQPKCNLFPRHPNKKDESNMMRVVVKYHLRQKIPAWCNMPGMKFYCQLFKRPFNKNHLPVFDTDGDGFSTFESLRGYGWRGKDCDDLNTLSHPGTRYFDFESYGRICSHTPVLSRPVDNDVDFDSNCNGIYGVNHETGRPYESELCEGTNPIGIMLIGDSAGAHFHIPAQLFRPAELTIGTLSHLPYMIENEFDWPMLSAATGYRNITWNVVENFTESVYGYLRQRNLCNHRDYQNLGVNGADSGSFLHYWDSVKRNQTSDYPVLILYEFVGNDVCNMAEDTLALMTTPEQMRKNTLDMLDKLDSTVPFGSHVLMTGLADGRFLWNNLHRRLHPLGELNRDVNYAQFYEYLTCVGLNPCNGWMTANETLRNLTSERSFELSKVLEKIALESQHRYKNFDLVYIDCPLNEIVREWEKKYGTDLGWQLIEPVDGFHPNKLSNNLYAKFVWKYLLDHQEHFIGTVNPNNRLIVDIFGDQGGHW